MRCSVKLSLKNASLLYGIHCNSDDQFVTVKYPNGRTADIHWDDDLIFTPLLTNLAVEVFLDSKWLDDPILPKMADDLKKYLAEYYIKERLDELCRPLTIKDVNCDILYPFAWGWIVSAKRKVLVI